MLYLSARFERFGCPSNEQATYLPDSLLEMFLPINCQASLVILWPSLMLRQGFDRSVAGI